MQINSVHLVNIRKHADRVFGFAPGVNLLYGLNGAGKSTVIEAISFALFDHLTVKPQSNFVRQEADSGIITVDFEHNNQTWRVIRGIGTKAFFDVFKLQSGNAEQKAHGRGESMRVIHTALGVPSDVDLSKVARDALIPPQGELAAGFNLPETGRIDYFTPVLNLDKYRHAWRILHGPEAELNNEIRLCQGILTGLQRGTGGLELEQAQEELQTYTANIAGLEVDVSQRAEQVEALAKAVGALDQQWMGAADKRKQLEDYQFRVTELGTKIGALEAYLPALETLPMFKEEFAGIEIDSELAERYRLAVLGAANLKGAVGIRDARLERLRQDYQSAQDRVREAEEARALLPDAEMSLGALEARYTRAGEQYALAVSEDARHDEALRLIEPGKPCPVCGEPLTKATAEERQNELRAAMAAATKRMADADKLLGVLPDKIAALRIKVQDYQFRISKTKNAGFGDLEIAISGTELELLDLTTELRAADARCDALAVEVEINKANQAKSEELKAEIQALLIKQAESKDLEDFRAELVSLQDKIQNLKAELVALPTITECNKGQHDLNLARAQLDAKRLTLTSNNEGQKRMQEAIEIIKDALALGAKMAKLEEAEALLVRCRQAISDIGPQVADQVMIQLGALAGKYWTSIGKAGALDWTGAFLVTVDGLDYRTQLSGGEKVIAALACRLAIAKYRADLGFMILDEPTIHLDSTSKQGLVEIVAELGLGQIIIVSHDDAFTAAATNVIEV